MFQNKDGVNAMIFQTRNFMALSACIEKIQVEN
jgi:hypothetical protein